MSQQLDKVIRHMVAWAGGDPCQVRLPRTKHPLWIHTQRVGDVRFITVAPPRGKYMSPDEPVLEQRGTTTDAIVLRGIVVQIPDTGGHWLAMDGAGAVPVNGSTTDVDQELRDLTHRQVIIRGTCTSQGIAVRTVQTLSEA